jgi:hypothetical protein
MNHSFRGVPVHWNVSALILATKQQRFDDKAGRDLEGPVGPGWRCEL